MLKLKKISKIYTAGDMQVNALKEVSLEFRESELVAILGPSGCGKTTMLNIIGGLDKYTSGDLIINGITTKLYKDQDWDAYRNSSIGFVFQNYNLISHLSVFENIELALTLSGVSPAQRREQVLKVLDEVGLRDQVSKKPNQLSGGQMQRVAIARALVNNPDIVLADEPTGALDSVTSVQIMELLKEVAKTRLVVMVTHNGELANKYANRIVRLLDGEVTSDSNPIDTMKMVENANKRPKKTSMSFVTAFKLSLRNLFTKKMRTFITSFAGSIGIIGVALILALSSGFTTYIAKMQSDTLSSYPLSIASKAFDANSIMNMMQAPDMGKFPGGEIVNINKIQDKIGNLYKTNIITDEYVKKAINTIDSNLVYGKTFDYGATINIFNKTTLNPFNPYLNVVNNWSQVVDNETFIKSQYDVLSGALPKSISGAEKPTSIEIAIVVDAYNQISDVQLASLGLAIGDKETLTFDEIMKLEFRYLDNSAVYNTIKKNGNIVKFTKSSKTSTTITEAEYQAGIPVKVSGILRANKETTTGSLSSTVAIHSSIMDYIIKSEEKSDIVKWQKANTELNCFTGEVFVPDLANQETKLTLLAKNLCQIGGNATPVAINIFPKSFENKELIKKHLDDYNKTMTEDRDKVYYSDMMGMMVDSMNILVNAITYVLIAFTSISLVVSSIMIGVITYISVLERTKEIGILKSIGARKKDISRVFNAEALIIGFIAGALGVLITLLLSIPLNMLLSSLAQINGLVSLNPLHAILLVAISMLLTFVAGLIPSRIAAKKDPVVALRTE